MKPTTSFRISPRWKSRIALALLAVVPLLPARSEADFAAPPPAIQGFEGQTTAARALNITGAEDVIDYFEAHRLRVEKLFDTVFENHWQEIADAVGVPPEYRNPEFLKRIGAAFMQVHDKAKMDPITAEGLFRIFGADLRSLPDGPQKTSALAFISWFNKRDSLYGEEVLRKFNAHPAVQKFCLFIEKVADNADRRMSVEAAVELGRILERAGPPEPWLIKAIMKDFDDPSGIIQEKLLRILSETESRYDELTRGMAFRQNRAQLALTRKRNASACHRTVLRRRLLGASP